MIKIIQDLSEKDARNILVDIMDIYLGKGFGLMNKTEIETLFYHVFRNHKLLTGKCYQDSFDLKITEAKARKLIYESQVKYGTHDRNQMDIDLREAVGKALEKAYFAKNNNEIRFAIEDKYIRVALNAKLRENNYFADTSFNKDIISLDEKALTELVLLLVPNVQKDIVLKKLKAVSLDSQTKKSNVKTILTSFISKTIENVSLDGIVQIGLMLASV